MSESQEDIHKMKTMLEEARDLEGRGTELISLYISSDKSINPYRTQISQEHSEADSIKSDRTRESVQSALSRVEDVLKNYRQTPENGLVVFAGRANGDMKSFVFDELPRELEHSNYVCSDSFVVEPLEDIISPDTTYGIIVIDKNESTIGELIGERINKIHSIESGVMGKTKAGGQSQKRFERERERQKHEFFTKAGNLVTEEFIEDNELRIEGLLLGGPNITVDQFREGDYIDYRLQNNIVSTVNTDYGNIQGLKQVVSESQQSLQEYEEQESKEYMNRFYTGLANEEPYVTYGEEEIRVAAKNGAIDILLLSENLDTEEIRELADLSEEQGGEYVIVPDSFERGLALWETFSGIAAILRYDMSWAE